MLESVWSSQSEKIFEMHICKGLPARLVKLVEWYGNTSVVKWNNILSNPISIKSGIRQGGVLSDPVQCTFGFHIWKAVVINALEISDIVFLIGQTYAGCIVYADDIILPSASVCRLQENDWYMC